MVSNQPEGESVARVRIEGEMTFQRAAELKELLLAAFERHAAVEVDLSRVRELDTAGLQLLVLAKRTALASDKTLLLVDHSAAVFEAFELLNIGAYFGDAMFFPADENAVPSVASAREVEATITAVEDEDPVDAPAEETVTAADDEAALAEEAAVIAAETAIDASNVGPPATPRDSVPDAEDDSAVERDRSIPAGPESTPCAGAPALDRAATTDGPSAAPAREAAVIDDDLFTVADDELLDVRSP